MSHILHYWPWLYLAVILFALPLVYIALEVAAAPLFTPDDTGAGELGEVDEVDEAYLDAVALTVPCCPQHGGLRLDTDGGDL